MKGLIGPDAPDLSGLTLVDLGVGLAFPYVVARRLRTFCIGTLPKGYLTEISVEQPLDRSGCLAGSRADRKASQP
jgi:hypothetical protein